MFPFVVLKVLYQIIRNIVWNTQVVIIICKKTVLIFTSFCVRNLFGVVFIPNIIYFIITVWKYRIINNFSIFSPDTIVFLFWKDFNVPPINFLNESLQFLTFADSLFISLFINNINYFILLVIIIHQSFIRYILHNIFCIVQ